MLKLEKSYFQCVLLVLFGTASFQVLAAAIDVTAKFTPDPGNPRINKFVNTTPVSGYCVKWPGDCSRLGLFSIDIPLALEGSKKIVAGHSDPRSGAMIKVPADFQTFDVVSMSGDRKTVQMRIYGIGGRLEFSQSVGDITGISERARAHDALWTTRSWAHPAAPCRTSPSTPHDWHWFEFFWITPSSALCAKYAKYDIEKLDLSAITVAYEVVTPDPLAMEPSVYKGSINYSVGPGGDFDFGDAWVSNDSVLTFNLALTVEHVLDVNFPYGADRLALIPAGGWQQWLNRGRRPEKLFATQTFRIWSSAPFSMQLQCEYSVGEHCGIQNEAGHVVSAETRVTLPPGVVDESNMSVSRHLLRNSTPSNFHSAYYVTDGRAALHFEVSRDSVEQMITHAGRRYSGNVTVVFDSGL